uniref:Heat shock 70 kDa protein 13 n=1 Tax=Wuchereria bancrofti TaxID=6293 RepID=A0A1I8EYL8_WUCBA
MSFSVSLLGTSLLSLLLAGYLARKYGLPPPAPKIAAIDLGTTFSSIGIYQAVTGITDIIADETGRQSIPSVVAFLPNGTVIVGSKAVEQQEHNPLRTIYDAKRFIGRKLSEDDPQFQVKIRPEEVGAIIINYLRKAAEKKYGTKIIWAVISVPAEFDEEQRNATSLAVEKAGMESRRVISEPTAAALAYGLHKKKDVQYIVVVDLGGGTLDVSILWLQGGIFMTVAMAGNNRLGGQDFNNRVQSHLMQHIKEKYGKALDDQEDIQQLRLAIEAAKIQLTTLPATNIDLNLRSLGKMIYRLTRDDFEFLNEDLFESIIEPIEAALNDAEIKASDIDEIVLVGGSTRIPRVRSVVGRYFGKAANHGVDPELAVVTGAAVQAGVIGGGWPLQVSAIELPVKRRKRHIFTGQKRNQSVKHSQK